MDERQLERIEAYTRSGNGVPVTRVTLDADELRALIAKVRLLQGIVIKLITPILNRPLTDAEQRMKMDLENYS